MQKFIFNCIVLKSLTVTLPDRIGKYIFFYIAKISQKYSYLKTGYEKCNEKGRNKISFSNSKNALYPITSPRIDPWGIFFKFFPSKI
ncbi:MAG: hypothetical protein EAZ09_19055 [Oscillatoriales cyanobacterium]|nr:MAG: hypothetical protein EAZ09_19055 [Oscillatoriales cyanobacterium]